MTQYTAVSLALMKGRVDIINFILSSGSDKNREYESLSLNEKLLVTLAELGRGMEMIHPGVDWERCRSRKPPSLMVAALTGQGEFLIQEPMSTI